VPQSPKKEAGLKPPIIRRMFAATTPSIFSISVRKKVHINWIVLFRAKEGLHDLFPGGGAHVVEFWLYLAKKALSEILVAKGTTMLGGLVIPAAFLVLPVCGESSQTAKGRFRQGRCNCGSNCNGDHLGFAFLVLSILAFSRSRTQEARRRGSVDVAVAASPFAGGGGAAEVGDDGFEITDEQGNAFWFGAQPEQLLFEIQIEGQGTGEIEREQRGVGGA
jgi:hypothetical protein